MDEIKVTLPNGMKVEGTADQIENMAKALGFSNVFDPSKYYTSDSRGVMLISAMNTTHLRNAILKDYMEWVKALHSITNPKTLVEAITNGISNKMWLAMLVEYRNRPEELLIRR